MNTAEDAMKQKEFVENWNKMKPLLDMTFRGSFYMMNEENLKQLCLGFYLVGQKKVLQDTVDDLKFGQLKDLYKFNP